MNLWFFLTVVCIVAIVSEVFREYVKARTKATLDRLRALEEEVARLRQQAADTEDLRKRVEVLEDIVTSSDYELERQFARLSREESPQDQPLRIDR